MKRNIAKKSVSVGLSLALTVGMFGLGFKAPIVKAYADQDNQANNPSVVQEQPKVSDIDNPKKSQPKQDQKQSQKQSKKQSDSKEQTVVPQNSTNTNETKTPVKYMDWNDTTKKLEEKTLSDYKSLDSGDRNLTNDKWYVVDKDITFGERMYCWGNDVHLVLKDGYTLNAEHGIECSNGTKISIYGQACMNGKINANSVDGDAAIGGLRGREGSNITINGGYINAIGSYAAAGIGGGRSAIGKYITINGGHVFACGGSEYAAGIGGGQSCEGQHITINGGNITANGTSYAAGIGGGLDAGGQDITINGGNVKATGGCKAAGIGGGKGGYGKNITIRGGDIYANTTGSSEAAGIGRGVGEQALGIHLDEKMKLKVGNVSPASNYYDHPGIKGDSAFRFNTPNRQCVHLYYEEDPTIKYMDWNDSTKQLEEKAITNYVTLGSFERNLVEDKWYVVEDDITQAERIYCYGHNVHLILKDGVTLNAKHGIDCSEGAKITIHCQQGQSGIINAQGNGGDAGIGGFNEKQDSGTIVINGGIINSTGGSKAAGIGGGNGRAGKNITINSGTVNATGGMYAAGIGGGTHGCGSNININGGTVTAEGGSYAAGIGGGSNGNGENISICCKYYYRIGAKGGLHAAGIGGGTQGIGKNITIGDSSDVDAHGGIQGAGIGGGKGKEGQNITINWGKVHAYSDRHKFLEDNGGAGIGGGSDGGAQNITINGGIVRADANDGAAAIGGGDDGDATNIVVNGGTVTAISYNGAGIGSGEEGVASKIYINGGKVSTRADRLEHSHGCGIGRGSRGSMSEVFIKEKLKVTCNDEDETRDWVKVDHKSEEDISNKISYWSRVNVG